MHIRPVTQQITSQAITGVCRSAVLLVPTTVYSHEARWLANFRANAGHTGLLYVGTIDKQFSRKSYSFPAISCWICTTYCLLMPNTHRQRRRDETVELRRVGGVNTIRN